MKITKSRFALVVLALTLAVPSVAVAVSPFIDVTPGRFYENPINWAATNNITTGSPAGSNTFKPDNPVTRGEVVTFLKRYNDNITQPDITAVDSRVTTVDQHVTDLGQTVGTLGCATNQVAHYNGTTWVCSSLSLDWSFSQGANVTIPSTNEIGRHSSIAIGVAGVPVIAFHDTTSGNLQLVHCTSPSCSTHDAPVTVDPGGSAIVGQYTSIAIGTDGFPVISYLDTTGGNLMLAHCTNVACSSSGFNTVDNGGPGYVGLYSSVAIGTDGFPVIAYRDGGAGDLKVAHCTNTDCSTPADKTTVHGTGPNDFGSYASITIGTDGNPFVSYQDVAHGDLVVAHCANKACTGSAAITTVDTGGNGGTDNVGSYSSVAIGADGFPIISYRDATNGDLKVAHCADTVCNSSTNLAVATAGDVGYYVSLAMSTDGLPVISHYDGSKGDLGFVACSDTTCTTSTAVTLDSIGAVGQYTAIAVGSDGNPVISHYDWSNKNLKVSTVSRQLTGIAYG